MGMKITSKICYIALLFIFLKKQKSKKQFPRNYFDWQCATRAHSTIVCRGMRHSPRQEIQIFILFESLFVISMLRKRVDGFRRAEATLHYLRGC
jgi:hypothetical protein